MNHIFDFTFQSGNGRNGLYYTYTNVNTVKNNEINKAKDMCFQKLFNINNFQRFKKYKISNYKIDTIRINNNTKVFEWNPENININDIILSINYYCIPIHDIPKNIFDILQNCLIDNCQNQIGITYIKNALLGSKYILLAIAENLQNLEDKIILGFTYFKFVSTNYIKDIDIDDEIKNEYENLNEKDNIIYDIFNNNILKKNNYFRELNISDDEYINNKLYIPLICSNFGAGGEMLYLLQSEAFYKFIKQDFNIIYLDSVEAQYNYYTIKHDFLRTIDMINIFPQYKNIYSKNIYRVFDKFTDNVNKDKITKSLLLGILNKNINKFAFSYENYIEHYSLAKYIPRNQNQKDIYNNFLNSLQDIQTTTSGGSLKFIKYNNNIFSIQFDKFKQKEYIKFLNKKLYLTDIRYKYRYINL